METLLDKSLDSIYSKRDKPFGSVRRYRGKNDNPVEKANTTLDGVSRWVNSASQENVDQYWDELRSVRVNAIHLGSKEAVTGFLRKLDAVHLMWTITPRTKSDASYGESHIVNLDNELIDILKNTRRTTSDDFANVARLAYGTESITQDKLHEFHNEINSVFSHRVHSTYGVETWSILFDKYSCRILSQSGTQCNTPPLIDSGEGCLKAYLFKQLNMLLQGAKRGSLRPALICYYAIGLLLTVSASIWFGVQLFNVVSGLPSVLATGESLLGVVGFVFLTFELTLGLLADMDESAQNAHHTARNRKIR